MGLEPDTKHIPVLNLAIYQIPSRRRFEIVDYHGRKPASKNLRTNGKMLLALLDAISAIDNRSQ